MIENDFPEKLLYYSKIDKYCIDLILRNTLGFTDPIRGFNDPLDCFFELDFSGWQKEDIIKGLRAQFIIENYIKNGKEVADLSKEDLIKIDNYSDKLTYYNEEVLKQEISEYHTKGVRDHISKILRIRSFSAQTADKTLNNIMFSHYGNSHKGLCYIFDSKKLTKSKFTEMFTKVDYLPTPALIDFKASKEEYSEEELRHIGDSMVRIKHEDWQYENEWRLTICMKNPSENIYEMCEFEMDALDGIVLGLKTTTEDEERIKELVEKRPAKVNIYKAKRRHGSFYLDYKNNKIN